MKRPLGHLRIIGGEHRSRIVAFDPGAGVRPTPDRVRQTLYDWLAPLIEGAHVLDLFAGSGALGLEALSRGAGKVTFVESGKAQCEAIRAALKLLRMEDRAEVRHGDALGTVAAMSRSNTNASEGAAMGRSYTNASEGAAVSRSNKALVGAPHRRDPSGRFDIVLLDPPFDSELAAAVLPQLPPLLKPNARVYVEWHRGDAMPWPPGYTVLKEKKAGQVSYALASCASGT